MIATRSLVIFHGINWTWVWHAGGTAWNGPGCCSHIRTKFFRDVTGLSNIASFVVIVLFKQIKPRATSQDGVIQRMVYGSISTPLSEVWVETWWRRALHYTPLFGAKVPQHPGCSAVAMQLHFNAPWLRDVQDALPLYLNPRLKFL